MNRIILLLLVTIAISFQSKAQDSDGDDIEIGLKVGFNNSNVYDEVGDQFVADNKLGFVGGGLIRISLGKYIGLQPEFMIAQKGFVASGNFLGGSYDFTRTTTFFEIPLLLQIKANKYFSFVVGPQYNYLIRTRDEFRNGTISAVQEDEISNDNFRKNILAFTVGADVTINQFLLSGRAGWDIQKNNGDGTNSTPRYKNNWIQGTVGYLF